MPTSGAGPASDFVAASDFSVPCPKRDGLTPWKEPAVLSAFDPTGLDRRPRSRFKLLKRCLAKGWFHLLGPAY